MDQGVIESFKSCADKPLSEILCKLEIEETKVPIALKSVNIEDVIYRHIKKCSQAILVKSLRKLWSNDGNNIRGNLETKHNSTDILENSGNDTLLADLRKFPDCNELIEKDVQKWVTADNELEN